MSDSASIVIRYNPNTASTEIESTKGTLVVSDEMLRTKKRVCKALDDLIEKGEGGPAGTLLIEASSATHNMVGKIAELMKGKKSNAVYVAPR